MEKETLHRILGLSVAIPTSLLVSYLGIVRNAESGSNQTQTKETRQVALKSDRAEGERISDDEYREQMLEKDLEIRQQYQQKEQSFQKKASYRDRLDQWENEVDTLIEGMKWFESGKGDPKSVYSRLEKDLKALLQNEPMNPELTE